MAHRSYFARPSLLVPVLLCFVTARAAHPAPMDLEISLTASDHHGYNISCNGAQDGWIDLTITGGVGPFLIDWSNKETTEDISGLAAGYYHVYVQGSNGERVEDEITLVEPLLMTAELTKSMYSNGYNISCFECSNGYITTTVTNGVAPLTFEWQDAVTTVDRTNLGPGEYKLNIEDANGCKYQPTATLSEPARSDWTMNGNADTDPATQYFGTSDNKDFVFKTNATERLRLLADGTLRIPALGGDEDGLLRAAANGNIGPVLSGVPVPYWRTNGNYLASTSQWLGTKDLRELVIKTNNTERMQVTASGRVGIGTSNPSQKVHIAHTDTRGGLNIDQVGAGDNAHSEIRFMKNGTGRWALGCDMGADGGQDFFLWDQTASASRLVINSAGKVGIGTEPPSNSSNYKLYVDQGIATRDVWVTSLSWPDYVFGEDYDLLPLDDLRIFLLQEHHLPGIPSAQEVEKAGSGFEVGDLSTRLLKALEEQTLYILQLQQELEALKAKVDALNSQR